MIIASTKPYPEGDWLVRNSSAHNLGVNNNFNKNNYYFRAPTYANFEHNSIAITDEDITTGVRGTAISVQNRYMYRGEDPTSP